MDSKAKTAESGDAAQKVAVTCPECRQSYRLPTRLLGRRLVCRQCRGEFRAVESDSSLLAQLRGPQADQPSDSDRSPESPDAPSRSGTRSEAIDTRWAGQNLGRYQVRSILGQGGMGVVWRGHDDRLRRDVALKILNRSKSNNGSIGGVSADLFMQEARAVAKLQHPSVVAIYEVAEDQGQVFLSLELMEGGTLKEYVDRNGPMKPRELFNHMIGPAKALALAHDRGIIHRDIKPGNLMFDDHGHLKLMDFGLADVRDEAASERIRGKAVGSLGWIAPETALGKGTTPRSDVYGMGLVLLYALTGKPLIHGKSRSELVARHKSPPEPDFKSVRGLTSAGERLIRRCLAVDPAHRFQTAHELLAAIQACAAEDPAEQSRRRRSHFSTAAAAAVIGVMIGVGGVVYYFLDLLDREEAARSPVMNPEQGALFITPEEGDVDILSAKQAADTLTEDVLDPPAAIGSPADHNRPTDSPAPQSPPDHASARFASLEDAKVPWPDVPYLVDPAKVRYVATTKGRVYHLAEASCGRKIFASNLIAYESKQDAESSGRPICPSCARLDDGYDSKMAGGADDDNP